MSEKTYKLMRAAGGLNIALGVVFIVLGLYNGILLLVTAEGALLPLISGIVDLVLGIAGGVILIVLGGMLQTGKTKILF